MPFSVKLPRAYIPGAVGFNKWLDKIVSSIESLWNFHATGNVTVKKDPVNGIHLHVPPFPRAIFASTATSTPRSGSTPGFVTGNLYLFNGTSFVADASRTSQKIYIFSASTNTIPSGKYGACINIDGYWFVIAVEC